MAPATPRTVTPGEAEQAGKLAALDLGTAAKRHSLSSPMRTNLLLEALLVAALDEPIPDPAEPTPVVALRSAEEVAA